MIQKGPSSMRRPSFKSQSPSVRSTSSFSNLKRGRIGSGSLSASSSRSSSPLRSISSSSDHLLSTPAHFKISRRGSLGSQRKQEPYNGIISVVIRLKPSGSREKDPWIITDPQTMQHVDVGEFKFDHVFRPGCSNVEVYGGTSKPMIDRVMEGFNATVFAYGMTGSGKTFTMMGTEEELGLIPLSVAYLFSRVMEESLQNDDRYEIAVSYLEIYNEKVYDLLDCENEVKPLATSSSRMLVHVGARGPRTPIELKLREDSKYGVKIVGLTEKRCESSDELLKWIRIGDKSRKTGETIYNTRSSRSHAIVLIRLTRTDLKQDDSVSSTLSLCDLAGSEKAVTQNERRKEGAFINKSLLALGTVISKLSAESTQRNNTTAGTTTSHIPYRDSKLTRILQPALSGNGIVTTICTIDTKQESASETLNTLRFASRAKNVSLHVFRKPLLPSSVSCHSIEEKDRIIATLTKQLDEQHVLIAKLKENPVGADIGDISDPNTSLMETENKFLKYKLEHCEKLLDKDTLDLQDSEIAEIVDILPVEVGTLLETKFQGLESQLRQYKDYTRYLEHKVAELEIQIQTPQSSVNSVYEGSEGELVAELQKSLERKDKMIEALQSARRLRERALRPLNRDELNAGTKEEFF
ncbi:KIP2 (YPL155C) [Zygosaccharomyces parabailii]|nr:KIP2 (YPL155C) [Zygosaccharomyces parabailii]CDH08781.1 related to Kinesin-like protein KIP2 [Zygosaccharomyces bailii ISA1307]